MGLDGVELLLAVEEEFQIHVDDADAANIATPRMLADYVVSHLPDIEPSEGRCLSQAGFYRIRSALIREFGAQCKDIKPDSLVRDFLKGDIRRQWRQLGTAIGAVNLPRLECRKNLYIPISLGFPTLAAVLLLLNGHPLAALLAFCALWLASHVLTDRLADVIPGDYASIDALVPYADSRPSKGWTPDSVLQRVIQLTAVQTGIPAAQIKPDHRFVDDLGLD